MADHPFFNYAPLLRDCAGRESAQTPRFDNLCWLSLITQTCLLTDRIFFTISRTIGHLRLTSILFLYSEWTVSPSLFPKKCFDFWCSLSVDISSPSVNYVTCCLSTITLFEHLVTSLSCSRFPGVVFQLITESYMACHCTVSVAKCAYNTSASPTSGTSILFNWLGAAMSPTAVHTNLYTCIYAYSHIFADDPKCTLNCGDAYRPQVPPTKTVIHMWIRWLSLSVPYGN